MNSQITNLNQYQGFQFHKVETMVRGLLSRARRHSDGNCCIIFMRAFNSLIEQIALLSSMYSVSTQDYFLKHMKNFFSRFTQRIVWMKMNALLELPLPLHEKIRSCWLLAYNMLHVPGGSSQLTPKPSFDRQIILVDVNWISSWAKLLEEGDICNLMLVALGYLNQGFS